MLAKGSKVIRGGVQVAGGTPPSTEIAVKGSVKLSSPRVNKKRHQNGGRGGGGGSPRETPPRPNTDRATSHGGDKKPNSNAESKDVKELVRLLELLTIPASKQQLPSIEHSMGNNNNKNSSMHQSSVTAITPSKQDYQKKQNTEALALEQFSLKYQMERSFSTLPFHQHFVQMFSALVKNRLCSFDWTERAPSQNILRVLICLRMLMRDAAYQKIFFDLGGVKELSDRFHSLVQDYLASPEQPFITDILKEMTNIFQKLLAVESQRGWLVACGAHKPLVLLLSSRDVMVLHCTMHALLSLAQSSDTRSSLAELNCIETLLIILQEYDLTSKKLAASLLRMLCGNSHVREQVKVYDGILILLSVLHCSNLKLLWNVVWCVVQLSEDLDTSNDIRQMGGIPLILSILNNREYVPDKTSAGVPSSATLTRTHSLAFPLEESQAEEEPLESVLSLQSACCAALTELVLNDANAQQIVQHNGIYSLGILIFPQTTTKSEDKAAVLNLQKTAIRTLRFLFSMERNRQLFKRLFPADLFAIFIDVGHYVRDIKMYDPLINKLNSLPPENLEEIKEKFQTTNQNRNPTKHIGNYAVYEHLGTGGFGSVYKVKKKSGDTFLAMKEIPTLGLGKTAKEKDKSIGDIISELNIIKEQMRHPNVVRYYKTFRETDKLYVVMEYIEGAPLQEHFNSLKEKGEKFSEERIWNIFIQMTLALRYLHKEKKIVHRDLTPNNIMLGENDKVTITDFGLAKQKKPDVSKMMSVVGTIFYSCPELVQSQPYTEKADIWALGCNLYQMCTLEPPFYSSNMLSLAKRIVEADFTPLPDQLYSPLISETIKRCLAADPDQRPDIIEVGAIISDVTMSHMDQLRKTNISLERKLEREKKRTQKHYNEATLNMQNYHRLFLASQERYDKLLASSGGASSIKSDSDLSDTVFDDQAFNGHVTKGENEGDGPGSGVVEGSSGDEEDEDTNNNSLFHKTVRRPRQSSDSGILSLENSGNGVGSVTSSSGGAKSLRVPKPPLPGGRGGRGGANLIGRLTLDIPASSPGNSGTPSPNDHIMAPGHEKPSLHRSQSSSTVEISKRQNSQQKNRPHSSQAATLTISPRKVRQINDPIQQLLHQLHKIIFVTQLPPTLDQHPRRRVVERFKKVLFSRQSYSFNLKNELKKLMLGSRELIDLNFGAGDTSYLLRQANLEEEAIQLQGATNGGATLPTDKSGASAGDAGGPDPEISISYEQMQSIIESVLKESGYYHMSELMCSHKPPRQPLAPISSTTP